MEVKVERNPRSEWEWFVKVAGVVVGRGDKDKCEALGEELAEDEGKARFVLEQDDDSKQEREGR